jgi:hypothetical protein
MIMMIIIMMTSDSTSIHLERMLKLEILLYTFHDKC